MVIKGRRDLWEEVKVGRMLIVGVDDALRRPSFDTASGLRIGAH